MQSRIIELKFLAMCIFLFSCGNSEKTGDKTLEEVRIDSILEIRIDSALVEEKPMEYPSLPPDYDTLLWTDISRILPDVVIDLKYATTDNFLGQQLYDCPRCFLRPEVAKALQKVHFELGEQGYGILLWDCYRPQAVQRKMWEVMPNPNYVANPERGSMHSRGVAVDLSIVDENGMPLNMGTEFDHFGKEAHYDNRDLPDEVLRNRDLLRSVMEKHGLMGIRTEWWHFSMRGLGYPLDEMVWECQ